MSSSSGQKQNQIIVVDAIDQQPVRLNVTFPETFVNSGKFVVTVLGFKRLHIREFCHDFVKQIKVVAAFFRRLQVFLELIGKNNIKHLPLKPRRVRF